MQPGLIIPGWQPHELEATLSNATYTSAFGDPRETPGKESYAHVAFSVHKTRPVAIITTKVFVPLMIVMLIAFSAFFMHPTDLDSRVTLTITALLSAVALQFSYMQELPPTGYLTLLDKVYALAYALILAANGMVIVSNRLAVAERPEAAKRADTLTAIILPLLFFVGSYGLYLTH
jgi:hypothetical protein